MNTSYGPTDVAVNLVAMRRDQSFIESDMEDEAINNLILEYECKSEGTTIREMDESASDEEKQAYAEVINQIPVDYNEDHEELMRILQCGKDAITIDEAMGLEPWDDKLILEELTNLDGDDE